MNLVVTVASFLVTVGVLVVIHELGHYTAARLMDVKILRFNVGFGRPLWLRRIGPDRTEWVIAAIPLGGYVKMLDEREAEVPAYELARAFNRKSVGARIFIVLAGPIANLALAVLLFWALFVAGTPGLKPMLGEPVPGSAAAAAGLANGDTLRGVGDEAVYTWTDVRWVLLNQAVKREPTTLLVESERGGTSMHRIDLAGLTKDDLDHDFVGKLGLRPFTPPAPAHLGRVLPDHAGQRAGLADGDLVLAIDGNPVATWAEFTRIVLASPGKPITLEIERGGRRLKIQAVPESITEAGTQFGRLGVEMGADAQREYERMRTTVRFGPVEAAGKAVAKVADLCAFTFKMLGRMAVGQVSWRNLSGPITIADYAGQSAQQGWIVWLGFLALVSVSLGVLNLLPIPLLDGGHLVYYFAEIVKGSPVSDRAMEIGQRFGLALLLGLTVFAFYNDINRLFTG
jgi:regulator of sigma E protease